MKRSPIIPGTRFGRLVVLYETNEAVRRRACCLCDCGHQKMVRVGHLKGGMIQSCGCLQRTARSSFGASRKKHGQYRSREYSVWNSIKDRCENSNSHSYSRYGAVGISMCPRWRDSFESFLEDMGPRPKGTSIDRIDNSKGYEPGNCRWATPTEQSRNRRFVRQVSYAGKSMTIPEWAEFLGIKASTLHKRLRRGSISKALIVATQLA